jgi:hypothetical protein
MVEIVLLSKTETVRDFLPLLQKVLKRNVARGLDARKMAFEYLSTIGEFHQIGTDPLQAHRDAGSQLRHLHFSFLVVTVESYLQEIAMEGLLGITLADAPPRGLDVAIMSGNLEQWRTTIINGCSDRAIDEVREFCTKILAAFDLLGYTRVFEAYTRKQKSDGLLLLTYKG